MTDLSSLLEQEPVVATAGVELLAETLETQRVRVAQADWRPPVGDTGPALATLSSSDRTVTARGSGFQPAWTAPPAAVIPIVYA